MDWKNYSLNELRQNVIRVLRQGGGTRPDILLVKIDDNSAVLKDYGACNRWFSLIFGRFLCHREWFILSKLRGYGVVPTPLAKFHKRAFLMTYHEALPVPLAALEHEDWQPFLYRLQEAIRAMHQRGVTHNDLRNRHNILVTADKKPVLIDLAASVCFTAGQPSWLFNKLCVIDNSILAKLAQRYIPDSGMTFDSSTDPVFKARLVRIVTALLRSVFKLLFTKQSGRKTTPAVDDPNNGRSTSMQTDKKDNEWNN